MDFDDYQDTTPKTAVYPKERELEYLLYGLCSEVGELHGKVKKVVRGDKSMDESLAAVEGEIGDILWYISQLCNHFDFRMMSVAYHNIQKLRTRAEEGKIKGEGDER